ncbi:MAG: hypothetical protein M3248_05985 [Actinomycetota bacterium]|jgi:hypothetical protein|nr:hypothetical protein [Actinomycetota bacterium]HZB82673.1 hypothetical protein [Rubrobacteraceae bacterium]
MNKLYLALVLTVEAAAIVLLSFVAPGLLVLLLVPIPLLTLVVALLLRHIVRHPAYGARWLSPEAIVKGREREPPAEETPEELSRRIVERADEIHRTLLESPSEIQIEMCALGYRACVNDMITLTHLANEELPGAGPIRRFRLRAACRRATDSLSEAKEAMPPDALRATRERHQ